MPQLFIGVLFRVPDYQRGYAWTRLQLEDLWNDVEVLDEVTQHFTGMIVVEGRGTQHNELDMQDFRILEVIDGQQRLTTLVLLIQAIIRELRGLDLPNAKTQADRLEEKYIGGPGWHRLALNEDSRAYFGHLLSTGTPLVRTENGSQQNLLHAFRFFEEKLSHLPKSTKARYASISTLVRRIQSNLRFVHYQVDNDAEAGLIFEVMNNRGKALSEADRLKNYLMYLAHKVSMPDDSVKGIARSWGDVFKQVMRASPEGTSSIATEDRLLRNHWIIYQEDVPPKQFRGLSTSQRIKQEMLLTPVPEAEVKARNQRTAKKVNHYTLGLVTSAHDFADLLNPDSEGALEWIGDKALRSKVLHELLSFTRMGRTATALPLLLAGRRRLQKSPELFFDLASALSSFTFRVSGLCGRRSNAGQNHFKRLAKKLFDVEVRATNKVAAEVATDVRQRIGYYANDGDVRKALNELAFYDLHSSQDMRYLFYEYEIEKCHGQEPSLAWSAFSDSKMTQIEHIWSRSREGYFLGGSEKAHAKNVNRLGNLTVTHFNQKLSNRKFGHKKPIYQQSSLIIEHELQHYPQWNLNVVEEREGEIIDFVLGRWKA